MRRMKWTVVVGLVALAVGAVGALQAQQPLSGEYKIGVLEPLTGNLAAEGKRHLEGYEIVRDLINERGGVMGKKLVFVVGDAVDPTVAASEATRLATREGVKIITGTFSSTLCGAVFRPSAGSLCHREVRRRRRNRFFHPEFRPQNLPTVPCAGRAHRAPTNHAPARHGWRRRH